MEFFTGYVEIFTSVQETQSSRSVMDQASTSGFVLLVFFGQFMVPHYKTNKQTNQP